MSASVEIDRQIATVRYGKWRSANRLFARLCEGAARTESCYYEPDPDWRPAERVAAKLGGRVIRHDPPGPDVPGRIYDQRPVA
jgi:hypothetical protein